MAIDVYWASCEEQWLRATPPIEIKKLHFSSDAFKAINIIRCPATRDFLHNYYGLKSLYTYNFYIREELPRVYSNDYDQKFYDNHVLLRDINSKSFTFGQEYVFFTEHDSLLLSQEQPFLEDTNINDRCIIYPGKFDIGKWFRGLEFAFRLKQKHDHFSISENEIYSYVKFHTDEDVNLIQFRINDGLKSLLNDINQSKFYQSARYRPLQYRYDSFSTKKLILQEIKKNVLT